MFRLSTVDIGTKIEDDNGYLNAIRDLLVNRERREPRPLNVAQLLGVLRLNLEPDA